MVGCESDAPLPDYPLDGITVYIGFDEPVCGGTFDWIEARLRWLAAETGLPAATSPIFYYWLREDVYDHCPTGACASASDNTIYTPLELFSHELVHGHLAQLGLPRPWLAEGMAQLLEDTRWDLPDSPVMPSMMLETTKTLDLDYTSAASFVRYLRDRFGMTLTSSATISIGLLACDEPLRSYTGYDTQLDVQIEMVPGRKRLMFSADIADEAVGELVLRGPLAP